MGEFVQVIIILCVFFGFLISVIALYFYNPDKFNIKFKKNKVNNENNLDVDISAKKDSNECNH